MNKETSRMSEKTRVGGNMEERDFVDKNRKPMGETTTEESKIAEGKYIQIVIICMENHKKEFLIQKRAQKKNGKWALTGGHVISGEESVHAILREVQEELGLQLEEEKIEFVFSKRAYDCFVDIYYTKKEVELLNLKLEKEEVETVKWMSLEEIKTWREKNLFLDYHYDCLQECIYFLEKIAEGEKENV